MAATRDGPNLDERRRRELAGSFQDGGGHYDRVRPGYPSSSLQWLLAGGGRSIQAVLDVGAGTGKYTDLLLRAGLDVVALDPSRDMLAQLARRHPRVRTIHGAAEEIALPDANMDAAVVAQAWHWCDPLQASAEISRVLRPGGTLGLIWNQLDVSVPWVHRLSRIMHAGDVHRPGFRPLVGPEFSSLAAQVTQWEQPLTPADLLELAQSRSYYLAAGVVDRNRVLGNLRWYLHEHLGHAVDDVLQLPYLTHTWRADKHV
ncbi:class I SAM-dependent methyltransferase [Paenarthrobacter sp. Z7-10]|uniref:class I SAM-dependent methyltransferase n=1 Tax=Paenarthrobacter sp. Z7-10 TaxID=2787635 RepID=UPI0022A8E212|nr:class I SAM-dependent methyltransferase [Paenarthrobacter sp. Z7-10]MCZ2402473.1 class I SAM-dependent methyltransferase [Paenarthrobacter sp. Z7-10]